MLLNHILNLKARRSHLDAKGFRFCTTSDGATIVIGEHNHRHTD
jgi:hypothetical protein